MSGERSGDDRLFEQKGDSYLPEEISSDRTASAGSFGLLIRSLLADAREAGRVQMTVAAWMDFMRRLHNPAMSSRARPKMNAYCASVCAKWRRSSSMGFGGKKVGYSVARELVRSALFGLSGSRGQVPGRRYRCVELSPHARDPVQSAARGRSGSQKLDRQGASPSRSTSRRDE